MTKSTSHNRSLVVIVVILLSICAVALAGHPASPELRTKHTVYKLSVADTEEARNKGLSGRKSLANDEGLVFVFDLPGKHCFWMKDMSFPIDIIWLDSAKKVVHIEQHVAPDSYPKTFCPVKDATHVVELAAGEAKKTDIREGAVLDLRLGDNVRER